MPIRFACVCGKRYQVADSAAGHRTQCKACGLKFRVPGKVAPQAQGSVFVPNGGQAPKPSRVPVPPPSAPVARPSAISYPCPHCDAPLEIEGEFAGGEATCGVCQGRTIVPNRSKPPASAIAARQPAKEPEVSYSGVTLPMLVSAISNLVYGILLMCLVVGIPMLVLCYYEYRLYSQADTMKPREFARQAKVIGAFEVVSGLINWFGLICGILVLINIGKVERQAAGASPLA